MFTCNSDDGDDDSDDDGDDGKDAAERTAIPLREAMNTALKINPGTVVEAELEHEKGVYFYEVEIVDADGKKTKIKVDASTGEVKSNK